MSENKKVIEKELKDFELDIKSKCLRAEFIDGIILNVKLPLEFLNIIQSYMRNFIIVENKFFYMFKEL